MPVDQRIAQIVRCMNEIEICQRDEKGYKGDPLGGPFLGQMDWLEELHYHIHNA